MLLSSARALIAAALAVFATTALVWEPFHCSSVAQRYARRTDLAERRIDQSSDTTVARENVEVLTAAVANCRRSDLYGLIGENLYMLGRYDEAVGAFDAALAITERPEFYAGRGAAKLRVGRIDAAVADLARGARFSDTVLFSVDASMHPRIMKAAEEQTRAHAAKLADAAPPR